MEKFSSTAPKSILTTSFMNDSAYGVAVVTILFCERIYSELSRSIIGADSFSYLFRNSQTSFLLLRLAQIAANILVNLARLNAADCHCYNVELVSQLFNRQAVGIVTNVKDLFVGEFGSRIFLRGLR